MKKNKIKMLNGLIKKTRKWAGFKTGITPNKVFYIWDRNNLTKIETFSI